MLSLILSTCSRSSSEVMAIDAFGNSFGQFPRVIDVQLQSRYRPNAGITTACLLQQHLMGRPKNAICIAQIGKDSLRCVQHCCARGPLGPTYAYNVLAGVCSEQVQPLLDVLFEITAYAENLY